MPEAPIKWLKKKFITGVQWKNQKAPMGRSGKSRTKGKNKNKPLIGDAIMLMNMSGVDHFCAGSGKVLPKRGIAYRHNGEMYVTRSDIPA